MPTKQKLKAFFEELGEQVLWGFLFLLLGFRLYMAIGFIPVVLIVAFLAFLYFADPKRRR